jgi:hypothetical protein
MGEVLINVIQSVLKSAYDNPSLKIDVDLLMKYVPMGANYCVIKYFSVIRGFWYLIGKDSDYIESEFSGLYEDFLPTTRTINEHLSTTNLNPDCKVLMHDVQYNIFYSISQQIL